MKQFIFLITVLSLLFSSFAFSAAAEAAGVIIEAENAVSSGGSLRKTLLMDTYDPSKFYDVTGVYLATNWYNAANASTFGYDYNASALTDTFKDFLVTKAAVSLSADKLVSENKISYGTKYDIFVKGTTFGSDGLDSMWCFTASSDGKCKSFASGTSGISVKGGRFFPAAFGIKAAAPTSTPTDAGYISAYTSTVWKKAVSSLTFETGDTFCIAGRESPLIDKILIVPSASGYTEETAASYEASVIPTYTASFKAGDAIRYTIQFEENTSSLSNSFSVCGKTFELTSYTPVPPNDSWAAAHPNYTEYFNYSPSDGETPAKWENYTLSNADITVNSVIVNGAVPSLPSIFADGMILQRSAPIKVWGTCNINDIDISVTLGSQTKSAAVTDGAWMITLDPMEAAENLIMTVSADGGESVTYSDIAIGEVWLCAGQSNMDFRLSNMEDYSEYANDMSNNDIRLFSYNQVGTFTKQSDVTNGSWRKASQSTANMFPAIGYVMAEKLYKTLGVPVGLIMSNRGDTSIDVWVSGEVLDSRPEYASLRKKYSSELAEYTANPDTYDSNYGKKIPTSFYNNMIYPIQPYTVKGALWYQGCNNAAGDQELYKLLFRDLTDSWRQGFNNPDMTFITFQLAPYTNSAFTAMRQTQFELAQSLDNVYLVSTANEGYMYTDADAVTSAIHPYRKSPLGLRAAHTALCRVYGSNAMGAEYSGPIPEKFTVNGSELLLTFSHTGGGLAADTTTFNTLNGFEISADGVNYLPAEAEITADGKAVKLQCAEIDYPKTVRYAYTTLLIEYTDGTYSQTYDSSKTVLRTTLGGNLTNSTGYPAPAFILDLSYSEVSARFYKSAVSAENEITSFNPKYDKIIANIKSIDSFDEARRISAVSAVYKNGLLDEIKATDILQPNTDINIEFGPFDVSAIYEMKVFFWNKATLKPLCNAYTLASYLPRITEQNFNNTFETIYKDNAAQAASAIIGANRIFNELSVNELDAYYDYANGKYKYIESASGFTKEDGDNFIHLHTYRTENESTTSNGNAIILNNSSTQLMQEDEKFVFSFDFYAPTNTYKILLSFDVLDNSQVFTTKICEIKFGSVYYYDGTIDNYVSYNKNAWNTFVYECDYGSDTAKVTLNGVEITKTIPKLGGNIHGFKNLKLTMYAIHTQDNDIYIDNMKTSIH